MVGAAGAFGSAAAFPPEAGKKGPEDANGTQKELSTTDSSPRSGPGTVTSLASGS